MHVVVTLAGVLISRTWLSRDALGSHALEVISPTPRCPGPSYATTGQESLTPAIAPRNDRTPSFTARDVLDYERTHPFMNHRMKPAGRPTVTKVLFITSAEASKRLGGEWIGLPDDALVSFVELYGTYTFASPFGQVSQRTGTMRQVFDAHTGVLLLSGM